MTFENRTELDRSRDSLHSDSDDEKELKEEKYADKIQEIKELLSSDDVDIKKLREFAISPGGFVTNELRRKAWPEMVGVDVNNIPEKPADEVLHAHRDYNQVVLDVNRSLKRFPPDMDETVRLGLQDQLVDLIMRVLVCHDELHYYQGYHDICVTFLLVVGEDVAFALVDKLSMNHLRDFMDSNMDRTKHILNYMYPLIGRENPDLRDFLEESEVGTVFSLSWLITWYGHVLPHLSDIVRCYDFFIACHPLMPVYLAAAIVLYRQEEILSSECDMCVLHGLLSKIPDDLPYEQLIIKASELYKKHSPDELAHEAILAFKRQQELTKARLQYNRQRLQQRQKAAKKKSWLTFLYQDGTSIFLKLTFWTLTAVISAALIAYISKSKWEVGWWT